MVTRPVYTRAVTELAIAIQSPAVRLTPGCHSTGVAEPTASDRCLGLPTTDQHGGVAVRGCTVTELTKPIVPPAVRIARRRHGAGVGFTGSDRCPGMPTGDQEACRP